ncbi:hypothetical protein DFH07DRAFT_798071 [Mycena maculata]|uniref:Fe2OG dioxygenase domain-containing protein n=1 Tax=Mycena maculata TaxID=230809 RepID=A0AAD7K2D9_9AGAR|nr:hypothetical protein DFH07DRAFT_798071 [Mycena maculata]
MTTVRYPPPPGPPPSLHTGVRYAPPPGPPPQMYATPPGPPQNATELSTFVRNSLVPLASRGWLSVPLPPDLESIYTHLFAQSAAFFALDPDSPDKTKFAAPPGKSASDEGFADIPGEKQLITLRRVSGMPELLRDAATEAWTATGKLFIDTVRNIAESLELENLDAFDLMSAEADPDPETGGFPQEKRASSLLRLFRYDRPPRGTPTSKAVVAEAHKDLGILTLVVGQSPGLDARDPATGQWVSVEDGAPGRLTATLLAGQTLSYLTRGLYASGVHRVSVLPPPTPAPADAHRFSLVFALRPAAAAPINTDVFAASHLIGPFPDAVLSDKPNNFPQCRMQDQPASLLFKCISEKHWNVNIAPEEREAQKKSIAAGGMGQGQGERETPQQETAEGR